jgi:hypothetical protein
MTLTRVNSNGITEIDKTKISGTAITAADTGTVTSAMIADGQVTSAKIADATIVNQDVSLTAAIAGTKVSPDFGSQAVTTTGTSTAASFIPTSSSVPANGVYLPGANSLGLATASTERVRVTSAGLVGIGSNAPVHKLVVSNGGAEGIEMNWSSSDSTNFIASYNRSSSAYLPLTNYASQFIYHSGSTERFRCDSSGRLLVGTSSTSSSAGLQVTSSAGGGETHISRYINSGNIVSTDLLGRITFGAKVDAGAPATSYDAASIACWADAAWGSSSDTPTRLVFSTCPDSGSSPVERLRITSAGDFVIPELTGTTNTIQVGQRITGSVSDGNGTRQAGIGIIRTGGTGGGVTSGAGIGFYTSSNTFGGYSQQYNYSLAWYIFGNGHFLPGTDNYNTVGSASARCSVIFAGTGTINTSDSTLKQDVEALNQAELNVATSIKTLIKKYRFIDAVVDKGNDARIHVGVIAQEVEQAFVDEGLDPRRYALFCEDELEDGSKRLGIRYDELLAFVIAAL